GARARYVLGARAPRESDAGARPRRLVHLSVHKGALRAINRALVWVLVDTRLDHFVIEVVPLALPLADTGKHRIAAVRLGDVVDQFHDQHRLSNPGPAEQANLAALGIRCEQINNLDARDQNLRLGRLVSVGGRILMDSAPGFSLNRTGFVYRITDHVDDA